MAGSSGPARPARYQLSVLPVTAALATAHPFTQRAHAARAGDAHRHLRDRFGEARFRTLSFRLPAERSRLICAASSAGGRSLGGSLPRPAPARPPRSAAYRATSAAAPSHRLRSATHTDGSTAVRVGRPGSRGAVARRRSAFLHTAPCRARARPRAPRPGCARAAGRATPTRRQAIVVGLHRVRLGVHEVEPEHPRHVGAERRQLQLGDDAQRKPRCARAVFGLRQPHRVVGDQPASPAPGARTPRAARRSAGASSGVLMPACRSRVPRRSLHSSTSRASRMLSGSIERVQRAEVARRPRLLRHRQRERLAPHLPAALVGRPPMGSGGAPADATDAARVRAFALVAAPGFFIALPRAAPGFFIAPPRCFRAARGVACPFPPRSLQQQQQRIRSPHRDPAVPCCRP